MAAYPAAREHQLQQRRPQSATDVRGAFAPVQTGVGQTPALLTYCVYVDAQRIQ
ncbi:hypothetical protein ALP58_04291 [Pseudomonas savastanoi]|uniref:Uncharacterized protein n=2 Tax=Pseudomonas syringae group TaxID=136849 RepID=A0A0P9NAA3_PSESX|nr:Unknown protein sequence [Pseudomonas syringae pv. castaneae]RMS88534.1 hypothetical protein ALP58_04291 [Pseudomonas savastanoi]